MDRDEYFTPGLQERLAFTLLERRGIHKFLDGDISQDKFIYQLACEWASLPKDKSNRGRYDSKINSALCNYDELAEVLPDLVNN